MCMFCFASYHAQEVLENWIGECDPSKNFDYLSIELCSRITLALAATARMPSASADVLAKAVCIVKAPSAQKGVYAKEAIVANTITFVPLSLQVALKDVVPTGAIDLNMKLENTATSKTYTACIIPRVVMPVKGVSADTRRGTCGTTSVNGFVPHYWFVHETDDETLVNMVRKTHEVKIHLKVGTVDKTYALKIPYMVNSRKVAKDIQLYVKKASVAKQKASGSAGEGANETRSKKQKV